MTMAVMNLALLVIAAALHVLWISSLVEFDGKCHEEGCSGCPYEDGFLFEDRCPYRRD